MYNAIFESLFSIAKIEDSLKYSLRKAGYEIGVMT